jgi:hypothetical protein
MPSFGDKSRSKLETCDPAIQKVLNEAIKHFDFSVIWGHRGQRDQDRAYRDGYSKTPWPNSRHNSQPSRAVDIVPYPGGFRNPDATFYLMATHVLRAANVHGVDLRWGGHWRTFKDLAHFELKEQ